MPKSGSKSVASASKTSHKRKRHQREVVVVSCPSDFPDDSKRNQHKEWTHRRNHPNKKKNSPKLLDWHDAAAEIHSLAVSGFQGKQKRKHQAEEYQRLTGRKQKKQHVPLPIRLGIRKKAAERERRARQEARDAGLVLPKAESNKKRRDRTSDVYGPAPSIGFMKKGVFRVKKDGM